ncbi:hypothetical protein PR202_ga07010 [Eleusine coracana subsp. coracana]|uniref:Uncharacterized protein n=1 Tax=Eleusine coracana subsp. coracana TaxID=191504 RepID=A0AAV5BWI4_ELECO|nr:hypothetical protein PR202_ga07010 [Eleusine coracana subsp. coracana]
MVPLPSPLQGVRRTVEGRKEKELREEQDLEQREEDPSSPATAPPALLLRMTKLARAARVEDPSEPVGPPTDCSPVWASSRAPSLSDPPPPRARGPHSA